MNVAKAQFIILLLLTGTLGEPGWASEEALAIEVFTDSRLQVVSGTENTTVYVIDRINRLQQEFSRDLPGDAETAKQLAMQRFQRMDGYISRELENSAKGLVQALQYGIDRYPAIVFEGEAVVYGITDIKAAARRYQQWQEKGSQQ